MSYDLEPIIRDGNSVRAHLAIVKESEGSFSVIVLNLPGCGSCGNTEEEAVANACEAIKGVVDSFAEDGEDVPWIEMTDDNDIPEGSKLKWIMVHV